jgi:6-phosphogluconolactonase
MKSPSQKLTERIVELLANHNSDSNMNIAISGGSSPDNLFRLWTGDYSKLIDWKNINLFWVDERCVSPDHPDSNYGRAFNNFIKFVDIPSSNVFRIKGEIDNLTAALDYEAIVRKKLNNKPGFDLVILGIGEDGHTSSVFPGQNELYVADYLYMPSSNPYNNQKRVALTLSGILQSKEIVFYVDGPSKLQIFKEFSKKKAEKELPAEHIFNNASKSWIYWDNAPSLAHININSIFVI